MTSAAIRDLDQRFRTTLRPRRVRSYLQFAEEEIILPTGPRKGLRFRTSFMPWTREPLIEFGRGLYRRFFGSGPVQGGKTMIFYIIPTMYHLFETMESVINGVPDTDLAQSIFDERLLPVIERTRYRNLLPDRGKGSRGGRVKAITFKHGPTLRFMGAGGGDQQRSSHTSRVVVITEMDKMDRSSRYSRESDPITQLEARARAFGDRALVFGECTMSIEEGRIYREVCQFGTDTRVYLRCQHCLEYVVPERDHFVGWQGAENLIQARDQARYACQKCGAEWTEEERKVALRKPATAARGQEISTDGIVTGEAPRTNTFGFRWNSMHSELTSMADIAEAEYRAEQSESMEDIKGVHQFVWTLPFQDDLVNLSGISRDLVLKKITQLPQGRVPDDAAFLTVMIDLGLYTCWSSTWAWKMDAQGFCVDYRPLDVPQVPRRPDPNQILAALRAFRDDVLEQGWASVSGKPVRPDLILVDSGGQTGFRDVAYTFCNESPGGAYMPSKGQGSGRAEEGWRKPGKGKGRSIGNEWAMVRQPDGTTLVVMHSDYWKREVHRGFAAPAGAPGSLSLFNALPKEHFGFARQITAERQEEIFEPGKGVKVIWNKIYKHNHYLDTAYGARCAADLLGVTTVAADPAVAPLPVVEPGPSGGKLRTKY
jgi:phage terminase large subunit GpA-like protein